MKNRVWLYVSIMMMFSGACLASSVASVFTGDPEATRFIDALNDPTEDNVAYIKWAIKKDPAFRYQQQATTNLYPLGIIFTQYPGADNDQKELYKKLFDFFFRAGTDLNFDPTSLGIDVRGFADLTAIGKDFVQRWTDAHGAVTRNDIQTLDTLLKENAYLLKFRNPNTGKTLLHKAADHFDGEDPKSVQMFTHLIRQGADYTVKEIIRDASGTYEGSSVEELMADETHPAALLFATEKAAKEVGQGFFLDSFAGKTPSEAIGEIIEKMKPYKQYIVGGLLLCIIGWLLKSGPKESKTKQSTPGVLEQIT